MSILDRLANRMGYRKVDQTERRSDIVFARKDSEVTIKALMPTSEYLRLSNDWINDRGKGRYIIDGKGATISIDLDIIESIWAVPVSGEDKKNE